MICAQETLNYVHRFQIFQAARRLAPMMRNATMRNRRDGVSGSAADEWEFQRRHWLGSRVVQGEGGVGAVLHGGEGVCLVSFDFSDLCCLPTGVVAPLEALFLPIQSLLKVRPARSSLLLLYDGLVLKIVRAFCLLPDLEKNLVDSMMVWHCFWSVAI